MTKESQLVEQLALEKAVRLGLCACVIDLVVEQAKLKGGNRSKALAAIQTSMKKTASSLKVKAKDSKGGSPDISEVIQKNVTKMLDQVFKEAEKALAKPVH
jgi:hypothetical protein